MTHGACVPVGSGAIAGMVGGTSYPSTPPKVDHGRRAGPGNDVQRLLPSAPNGPGSGVPAVSSVAATCAGEVVCVVCPIGQSRVTRGLAGRRRSAKEGVTAVASAQGSAARRQPQQGQGRRAPVQPPRKGDAPVSLVGADEPSATGGTVPVRQKGSRPRRSQPNAPKSAPAAGGAPRGQQGKQAQAGGAESAPEDAAVAPSEATGLEEDGALQETDLD